MIINYNENAIEFTESQLIAYIGNKRRLLPLIQKAFELLDLEPDKNKCTFYDPFSGTGVVSRYAKTLGYQVISNDWEPYSQIINKAFLEVNEDEINELFKEFGGIDTVLDRLNNISEQPPEYYIAKYYCPYNTNNPDLKNERLFYTKENGETIDRIRYEIDNIVSKSVPSKKNRIKNILLALLLYESATRANTSGVFKGFHQGFGGRGKDALSRILKPLTLKKPILYNNKYRSKVFKNCANKLTKKLCSKMSFDITYLDPPYNQHQYGSNYHLLNTIALNDKPHVNEAIFINGRKVDKSAIRKDWIKTKSLYCYRSSAIQQFKDLVDKLKSHYIIISYSIDGIIPFNDMLNILSDKGSLSIITSEYTKYRGGKQALTTEKSNIEFLFLVDTTKESNSSDILSIKEILLNKKIELHLKKTVDIINLAICGYSFLHSNDELRFFQKSYTDYQVILSIKNDILFSLKPLQFNISNKNNSNSHYSSENWIEIPYDIKKELYKDIQQVTNITKDREIDILLQLIKYYTYLYPHRDSEKKINHFFKKIPHLFKKFNNKKAYYTSLKTIQNILDILYFIQKKIPNLYYTKSFFQIVIRLKKLIEDKIHHIPDNPKIEMSNLKEIIKDQYTKSLGVA